MTVQIYGIPNCDTMKKARAWLSERGIEYHFHNYKKDGVDPQKLARWSSELGWEALMNRRGTTFRKLDEGERTDIDEAKALRLMEEHASLIRRPVAEYAGGVLVGFDAEKWQQVLG